MQDDRLLCLLSKALRSSPSSLDVLELTREITNFFGFDYYAVSMIAPVPISNYTFEAFSCYCSKPQIKNSSKEDIVFGPAYHKSLEAFQPVFWNGDMVENPPLFPEEFCLFELRHGWALSTRDPGGGASLICLARSEHPVTEEERACRCAGFTLTAQVIHNAMLKSWLPEKIPEASLGITFREKEVLRWAAEGKTSHETAKIMGISERTVNFHINNSVAKLGSTNRVQAVVKAAMLGKLSDTPPLSPAACQRGACASCISPPALAAPADERYRTPPA